MLDAGYVTICRLTNQSEPGDMPHERLLALAEQWYEERRIGYGRLYAAKGVNEQIDMLIRIWREDVRPAIGMYAVICEDQYMITAVNPTEDNDGLPVYELTLTRLDDNYDVEREN